MARTPHESAGIDSSDIMQDSDTSLESEQRIYHLESETGIDMNSHELNLPSKGGLPNPTPRELSETGIGNRRSTILLQSRRSHHRAEHIDHGAPGEN